MKIVDLKIRLAATQQYYYFGIVGIGYRRHGEGLSAAPISEHGESLSNILHNNIDLVGSGEKNQIIQSMGKRLL